MCACSTGNNADRFGRDSLSVASCGAFFAAPSRAPRPASMRPSKAPPRNAAQASDGCSKRRCAAASLSQKAAPERRMRVPCSRSFREYSFFADLPRLPPLYDRSIRQCAPERSFRGGRIARICRIPAGALSTQKGGRTTRSPFSLSKNPQCAFLGDKRRGKAGAAACGLRQPPPARNGRRRRQ